MTRRSLALAAQLFGLAVSGCATVPAAPSADAFFARLQAMCGQAYEGRLVTNDAAGLDVGPDIFPPQPRTQPLTKFAYSGETVPAYIEIELGVLEPKTLEQYHRLATNAGTTVPRATPP